jgi:hypothetical protein
MIKMARRHERISSDPGVMGGKPCIRGTRVPIDLILRQLGDRQGVEARRSPPTRLTLSMMGSLRELSSIRGPRARRVRT